MAVSARQLNKSLKEMAKTLAFRYTRLGAPRYPYNLESMQLAAMINEIERLKNTRGSIVEIGVARGMTTRFVVEHLVSQGMTDQPLHVIDTFNSFLPEHVAFELNERGKDAVALSSFGYNDFTAWRRNFEAYRFVTPHQGDCSTFDYASLAPIKLVLLDVDLYLPTKAALPKIYENLAAGGCILIDDVKDKNVYDGAYQAYMEFCEERAITPEVIGTKCGVVRKPA